MVASTGIGAPRLQFIALPMDRGSDPLSVEGSISFSATNAQPVELHDTGRLA